MCRLIRGVATAAVLVLASTALGQTESFTYQGQLKQQGSPLTDLVDMRFALYDSETAETPVAGPVVFDGQALFPVQVTDGLFAVELDFGAQALQQGGQWLGIEVRAPHDPNDVEAYTPLTPRQRLTAAPFALSVPGLATTNAGVEVSGDVHALGQIAASAYTSNSPLIFKVNPLDMECARFDDANCCFGLGIQAPQARLHVGGVAGVDGIMFPDGSLQTSAAGLGGGDGFWSPSGINIFNNNGGNVGIGRTNPPDPLSFANVVGDKIALYGDAGGTFGFGIQSARLQIHTNNSTADILFGYGPSATFSETMRIKGTGNVGIGTPTPASRLDIVGQDGLRITGYQPFLTLTDSNAGSRRARIQAVDGNFINFFTEPSFATGIPPLKVRNDGIDIVGQDGLRITGYQPFLTLTDSNAGNARGRIQDAGGSINFFTEASFATGVPPVTIWNSGNALQATHTGNSSTGAVFGTSTTFDGNGIIGQADVGSNAFGVWGRSANGIGGYFTGGTYALIADGRAKVDILEIAGADVAEKFLSSDDNVEPGTVMEIDCEHPGKLRVAREAYSSRVAGVVSGAGDIPVGAILGNLPGHEDAPPIALSGRVWVRCDASKASIAPGDMLTSSDTPGHAMKAVDRERVYGTILGKSMTALAQGERGLVLVLVNLQ